MGIRFDKNTRRHTNAPMFFFTGLSAGNDLCEEINGALDSRLSFYAYRLPHDRMATFGSSEGVVEGIGIPGFVISPFMPDETPVTIPFTPCISSIPENASKSFPDHSTSPEEHAMEVEAIKSALDGMEGGKVIAARVSIGKGKIDIGATFTRLEAQNPEAFVFCFSTPVTGCWIGASPETLLKSSSNGLSTMALAGTRRASTDGEWDWKNILEQKIVTTYIVDTFKNHGIPVETFPTFTKNAGKVEHLCTPVTGIPKESLDTSRLKSLLSDLSPTPALCGNPRTLALSLIKKHETFDRECYGGFCGPFKGCDDFDFHVILRCCMVEENRYCIFTGGGITPLSDPQAEWDETSQKSATILDSLSTG